MFHSPTISVPQPCHENWAAMAPATQGRHCAACAKTVVDFSCMSDAQVVAYLSQANGQTCGRFRNEQLSRPVRVVAVAPAASVVQRWAVAALVALGVAAALPATAQQPRPKVATQLPSSQQMMTTGEVAFHPQSTPAARIVRGQVINARTGQGLPGVTVLAEGTQTSTITQTDGMYELTVAADTAGYRLQFSAIGLETISQPIEAPVAQKPVVMRGDGFILGKIIPVKNPR